MTDMPLRVSIADSGDEVWTHQLLIGTATTGLVRIEWVAGRYGQLIPVNWSQIQYNEIIPGYYPLRYLVADAQNLIVQAAIDRNFEWLLLWEHDVIPKPDALIRIGEYMHDPKVPIVSGLYYNRNRPSDPLIFRGRGTGAFKDFKQGDLVWCDGVPTGFLLVHMSILKLMHADSEEYILKGRKIRRVFDTPRKYESFENGDINTLTGTSDLDWCTKVMEGDYFTKAGWPIFADKRYPFLVDTNIYCMHINPNGEQFP